MLLENFLSLLQKNKSNFLDIKTDISKIVKGCIDGNREMQKFLYDTTSPKLFTICLRYSSDYNEAQDMLQEGYIKLFKNLHKFEFTGVFMAWASRVVTNNCIDILRRKPNLYLISDNIKMIEESFESSVIENLIEADLMKIIQSLPHGYRTIFNLHVVDGYPYKEIAEMLNINEGTSKSQLNRARKLIQNKIKELEHQEEIRKTAW